jgi:hypothetical protein
MQISSAQPDGESPVAIVAGSQSGPGPKPTENEMTDSVKYLLDESRIPTHWYNLRRRRRCCTRER